MGSQRTRRLTVAVTRSTLRLWWVYVVMLDADQPFARFVYGYALTKAQAKRKADKRAALVARGLIY